VKIFLIPPIKIVKSIYVGLILRRGRLSEAGGNSFAARLVELIYVKKE